MVISLVYGVNGWLLIINDNLMMIITDNDYIEQISSIIPMHIILQFDLNPSVRCISVHLIISFRNVFEFTSQFYFTRWHHFTTMVIKWHWIKLKSCVIVCQCTKYFIDVFRNLLIFTSWNSQFSPVIVVNSTIYFFVTFFKSWRVAKPAENKSYGSKDRYHWYCRDLLGFK